MSLWNNPQAKTMGKKMFCQPNIVHLKKQQSIFVAGKTEYSLSIFLMDYAVQNQKYFFLKAESIQNALGYGKGRTINVPFRFLL